ncbi:MAG: hypothetical protein RLZZ263_1557, partial [Cyanobacteriota bacterium]
MTRSRYGSYEDGRRPAGGRNNNRYDNRYGDGYDDPRYDPRESMG